MVDQSLRRGALILCGGKSTRMGRDKAGLPFGPETMLQRTVRLVGQAVSPASIVLVAAHDQVVPLVDRSIRIARDLHPDRGPLEGLAAGLRTIEGDVDAVFVTSCDAPLLVPALIDALFDALGTADAAVPQEARFFHPLMAVYRTSLRPHVERLLAAERYRPAFLIDEAHVEIVPIDRLRDVDPQLASFRNLNNPDDYQQALRDAGVA